MSLQGIGRISVREFKVGLKRAVLGLPFYVIWNLVAYIQEQEGAAAKIRAALAAVPFIVISTAIWVAPWLTAGWVLLTLRK